MGLIFGDDLVRVVKEKEKEESKTYESTNPETLEDEIMNSCIPKNEREWWAHHRIRDLLERCYQTERELETLNKKYLEILWINWMNKK